MRIGAYEDYDPVEQDVMADEQKQRRYQRRLAAHPSCSDPDHPGCMWCNFDEEGDEDE
jgi:hypothetical protein